jgi:hypothetical protein
MGWSAGSSLAEDFWILVREFVPADKQQRVAEEIYEMVCDLDADDWDGTSEIEIAAGINQEEDEE